ncbi:hypothetical protein GGR90_003821 [Sphingopyxis italica]|uniref:Uncharacterized protein n=1 Tax=Sphingopyxis italica TaxID=1129133 RepID=A0A7X6BAR0_9SPHN|nr:hypothetical protein [Sphingopyxis italica]NJB91609.1 hypothetical protein [Sphingopyxis italica]
MSRRSINDLLKPKKLYCPSKADRTGAKGRFETKASARAEDAKRAMSLRRCAEKFPEIINAEAAIKLADKLSASAGEKPPATLASATFYRARRNAVGGQLWQLVETCGIAPIVTATIIPEGWDIPGLDLDQVDPVRFMERFRKALNRCGAVGSSGFIFAFMHGEYEASADVWQLHVHLVAGGEMVDVLKRLKKLKGYRTKRAAGYGTASPVYRRIRISDKPLTNLPDPLTYPMQSFWPARARYETDKGSKRQIVKRRIVEPFHTLQLLWIDRFSFKDLSLLMGLRVTSSGLKLTRQSGT